MGEVSVGNSVTFLFVPGDRPDRFAKATSAGADITIIDLEDAVAPGAEVVALESTVRALASGSIRAMVRVHAVSDARHADEVTALRALATEPGSGLLGIIVAKADDPATIAEVRAAFDGRFAVIPLIESASGLLAAHAIAEVAGVTRLALGAVDLSLDLGAEPSPETLSYARSHLVVVSRAAGIASPLDSPPLEISDTQAVEAAARRARAFGFGGSLAIHPAQLEPIRAGFAPTEKELDWARRVLAAEGGAAKVDGKMVDRPVTERAKALLARAGAER
jgi:citrate lyase subunit beta/citryl-CoA lyase